jgi:hypothetical protein
MTDVGRWNVASIQPHTPGCGHVLAPCGPSIACFLIPLIAAEYLLLFDAWVDSKGVKNNFSGQNRKGGD